QDFGIEAPHLFADLSRNLIDRQARTLLAQLARECGLAEHRDALLAGAHVNNTEDRPALHPLLRWPAGTPLPAENLKEIHASSLSGLDEMLSSAEQILLEKRYDDVVHIGIGGSDLGPRLALQALAPQVLPDAPRLHFVANMDGHELAAVLRGLKPERTLFIVASKSFGTAETLRNATSARAWFEAQGGTDLAAHFVALTARPDAAREFGVGRCFAFDDGVGG
ncbi:MAG: glucose-6-phosphate isomerase, partial [Phaeodactylibacter sp.]|nr:glucose-6-phosphate isomerase [Phaeodactylibacter sp.]